MKLSPPTRPSEALAASGVTPPASFQTAPAPRRAAPRRLRMRHWFALLVVLPTLLVAGYYVGFAADIYESEARFLVRSAVTAAWLSR